VDREHAAGFLGRGQGEIAAGTAAAALAAGSGAAAAIAPCRSGSIRRRCRRVGRRAVSSRRHVVFVQRWGGIDDLAGRACRNGAPRPGWAGRRCGQRDQIRL